MNFLNESRLRSFFGNPKASPYDNVRFDTPDEVSQENSNQNDDPFTKLMNAPTPAMDSYKQFLSSMPQRQDYKSGKVQKILAGIAGFSTLDPVKGYQTTKGILDEPYNEAMGRYKERGQNLGELANIEQKDTAGKIKLASDIDTSRRANTKDAAQMQRWNVLNQKDRDSIETGKQIVIDDKITGHKKLVDRKSGALIKDLGKTEETQAETRDAQFAGRKNLLGIQFGNQKSLQASGQANAERNITLRGDQTKAAAERRAALAKDKILSPTQDTAAYKEARMQHIQDNPANAKFWDQYGNPVENETTSSDWNGGNLAPTDEYIKAITDIRNRYNNIKNRSTTKSPTNAPGKAVSSKYTRDDVIKEIKKNFPTRPDLLTNENYIKQIMDSSNAD